MCIRDSCEGALLVIDASQGIQAQTISNLYLALEQGLEIIPVLNKIDLPGSMIEEVSDQIIDLLDCDPSEILHVSAKDVLLHLGYLLLYCILNSFLSFTIYLLKCLSLLINLTLK